MKLILLCHEVLRELLHIVLLGVDLSLLSFDVALLHRELVFELFSVRCIPLQLLRLLANFGNHLFLTDSVVFSFDV